MVQKKKKKSHSKINEVKILNNFKFETKSFLWKFDQPDIPHPNLEAKERIRKFKNFALRETRLAVIC